MHKSQQLQAERFDLLVHPGYAISRVFSRSKIDAESEKNIRHVRALWLDSISDAAKNTARYFGIVNSLCIQEEELHELLNPFRCLYREIVTHARQSMKERLFYFSPSVRREEIGIEEKQDGLYLARKDGAKMLYNSSLEIFAYGEHVGNIIINPKGGCVEAEAGCLADALNLSHDRIKVERDKSLPSSPCIYKNNPYPGFCCIETLYFTATELERLSESP